MKYIQSIYFITTICSGLLVSSHIPHKNTLYEDIVILLRQHNTPPMYLDIVAKTSLETGVPPDIFAKLIKLESNWHPRAVNHNKNGTKDYGIAQLNSAYLHEFANYNEDKKLDPFDPHMAILVAARHLAWLYSQTGSWEEAVMAYNAGLSRVRSGNIPATTRIYAERIMQ